jgi:hypothetical protein
MLLPTFEDQTQRLVLPVVTEAVAVAAIRELITKEASAAPRDNGLPSDWFAVVRTENPEMAAAIEMVMDGASLGHRRIAQLGMATAYRLLGAQARADLRFEPLLRAFALAGAFALGCIAALLAQRTFGGAM